MTDHTELKRLAYDVREWDQTRDAWEGESQGLAIVGHVNHDTECSYPVMEIDTEQYDHPDDAIKLAQFYAAANPVKVFELISEITKLEGEAKVLRDLLGESLTLVIETLEDDSIDAYGHLVQLRDQIRAALRGAA